MSVLTVPCVPPSDPFLPLLGVAVPPPPDRPRPTLGTPADCPASAASPDDEEEEELGDEEDLSVAQPLADEDSSFDDFDDEFDDDFEEDESDPDWDHPDEGEEPPPPSKGTGRRK